jgi:hypothetical protein
MKSPRFDEIIRMIAKDKHNFEREIEDLDETEQFIIKQRGIVKELNNNAQY